MSNGTDLDRHLEAYLAIRDALGLAAGVRPRLLRSFLDVGGNKTELAKLTHLSRPTLYSRLAALQRLVCVDLDDAESRTSLHVAMLVLDR